MKIAYLNPGGTIGGAEMVLLDVLSTLRGARPTVVLGSDGPLRDEVETLGIACEVLPMPATVARLGDSGGGRLGLLARLAGSSAMAIAYGARLARRLRALGPDLVQTNGMKMHLLGAWGSPRGVPVVWHMHDYLSSRPAMARLLRASARRRVEVVAVSRSVADDARATLPGHVPVCAISNGVDVDRFRPGPGDVAALDRAAGLPDAAPGTVRVGLVATFAAWKGHETFLEAASRVDPGLPARFYVVGGPIYRTAGSEVTLDGLRARAEALGLAGRVGFTGHRADPSEALRSLDVVVHASTRPEPFGRVIVEGMASGRAVVAMREGGAAELFRDGIEAIGAEPRDPAALAGAMARLIVDEGLRDRLGRAGRAAVLDRFDRNGLAGAWSALYDRRPPPLPTGPAPAPAAAPSPR